MTAKVRLLDARCPECGWSAKDGARGIHIPIGLLSSELVLWGETVDAVELLRTDGVCGRCKGQVIVATEPAA